MNSYRPVVGLTTYVEQARFGSYDTRCALLPMAYVQAVHDSGGHPVLIPYVDHGDADPAAARRPELLDGLDAIVFTGGADVAPDLYGDPPHERTRTAPGRDAGELPLLRAALRADLPVLGICRGMQLMAVAAGGRLVQHLPDALGTDRHRPVAGGRMSEHRVRLAPGSRCRAILGDSLVVNSLHHQGVADPGRLTPVGWCPQDDLVEAVEDPAYGFAVGVQWHAEEMPDRRLFVALVEAAGHRAAARASVP